MLLEQKKSCLLLVDVQQKLVPLVTNHQALIENCRWLLELAQDCQVPVMVTEQYRKGLGPTVDELAPLIIDNHCFDKVAFSVCSDKACHQQLMALDKEQVIVIGIETSVCILQTVAELLALGKQVFVVADAVSSRHQLDHQLALTRMQAAGAILISKEMVLFEWLRQAGSEQFKQLSQKYLR